MSLGGKAEMTRLRRAVAEIEGAGLRRQARRIPLARTLDPVLGGGLADDALHEIAPAEPADGTAAAGFALALAACFLKHRPSAALFVGERFVEREAGALYGPGLAAHGLPLSRLVFVQAPDAEAALWAMEEALKCGATAAVVGEIWSLKGYSLAASRRLLLAARKGRAPALLVLARAYDQADRLSSAAETRFEIAAAPSAKMPAAAGRDLPGPFACKAWLVKARLGSVGAVDDRAAALHGPSGDGRLFRRPIACRETGVLPDALWERGYNARAVRLEWRSEETTFDDPAISLSLAAASGDGPSPAARGH